MDFKICPKCECDNPTLAFYCRRCGYSFSELSEKTNDEIKACKDDSERKDLRIKRVEKILRIYKCVAVGALILLLFGMIMMYFQQKNDYVITKEGKISIVDSKTNSVLYDLIQVKHGSFIMGKTNEMCYSNEAQPVHHVLISSDYYIGETEVTNRLWNWVMNDTISDTKTMQLPKNNVSWSECVGFIERLNKKTNLNFRLPTEAEWEYAARGGNESMHTPFSGNDDYHKTAWFAENSGRKLHEVKKLLPNELGIYDMSGNVWEWCSDIFGTYGKDSVTDPVGAIIGDLHSIRGGGIHNSPACDLSFRVGHTNNKVQAIGFRIVLALNR